MICIMINLALQWLLLLLTLCSASTITNIVTATATQTTFECILESIHIGGETINVCVGCTTTTRPDGVVTTLNETSTYLEPDITYQTTVWADVCISQAYTPPPRSVTTVYESQILTMPQASPLPSASPSPTMSPPDPRTTTSSGTGNTYSATVPVDSTLLASTLTTLSTSVTSYSGPPSLLSSQLSSTTLQVASTSSAELITLTAGDLTLTYTVTPAPPTSSTSSVDLITLTAGDLTLTYTVTPVPPPSITIPLPGGQLTTLSVPAVWSTIFSLPGGAETTASQAWGSGITISVASGVQTTLYQPTAFTTNIPLPNGDHTVVTMDMPSPTDAASSSAQQSSDSSASSTAVPTLLPRPNSKVIIDNNPFLLPPCGLQWEAFVISVNKEDKILDQGFETVLLYCDRVKFVATDETFFVPNELGPDGSTIGATTSQGGHSVGYQSRTLSVNINLSGIQKAFNSMWSASGLLSEGFAKFGSALKQATYDWKLGVDIAKDVYLQEMSPKLAVGISRIETAFADLESGIDGIDEAVESARRAIIDDPDSIFLDPETIETTNNLANAIAQSRGLWTQFLDLAEFSTSGLGQAVAANCIRGAPIVGGTILLTMGSLYEFQLMEKSFKNFGTSTGKVDEDTKKARKVPRDHHYLVTTSVGTPDDVFEAIKFICGDGDGTAMTIGGGGTLPPAYFTNMNDTMAPIVKEFIFVTGVHQQPNAADLLDNPKYVMPRRLRHHGGPRKHRKRSTPQSSQNTDESTSKRYENVNQTLSHVQDRQKTDNSSTQPLIDVTRPHSRDYLKLLSSTSGILPGAHDYEFDPKLGQDSWIFIIDSGYNIDAVYPELSPGPAKRKVLTWSPGASVLEPKKMRQYEADGFKLAPDDMSDWHVMGIDDDEPYDQIPSPVTMGHGTPIAVLARGLNHGVASNANLYLIKDEIAVLNDQDLVVAVGDWSAGFHASLSHVMDVIKEGTIPSHKSVVSVSWEMGRISDDTDDISESHRKLWDFFLNFADARGVTIVTSAGNDGIDYDSDDEPLGVGSYLGDLIPTYSGYKDGPLITVGGTDADAKLWAYSTPEGSSSGDPQHPQGSVTLYAQAQDIEVPGARDIAKVDGTSYAAPMVAGLAAYFLSLDENQERFAYSPDDIWNGRTVGQRVKDYMVDASYQRQPDSNKLKPFADYGSIPAGDINVAYNLFHGRQTKPKSSLTEAITKRVRDFIRVLRTSTLLL